jgi:hypothetical protein
VHKEEFEDIKGVIRIEEEQTTQWPKEKVQKDDDLQNFVLFDVSFLFGRCLSYPYLAVVLNQNIHYADG